MDMPSINLSFLSQIIGPDKIGGWVRSGVAALFVIAVAKWPILGNYIDPAIQTQVAAAIAALVVGFWSQITKTDTAKLAAVAAMDGPAKQAAFVGIPDSAKIAAVTAMPDVEKIVVQPKATDGVGAALADPTQTKVVSQ